MTKTRAGFTRFPAVGRGARVALVAPASPFNRGEFDAGVAELRRLGFDPVFDDRVFERQGFVAGTSERRAQAFIDAWRADDVQAVVAVRGGYGSVETLPHLEELGLGGGAKAFVGYSDLTSIHVYLNCHLRLATVHGAMIDGRLARGESAYDAATFVASLGSAPLGDVVPAGLSVVRPGEAGGPIVGGTLTNLTASLGTPYGFAPPDGAVLFLEDVGERPYRVRRMLVQLRMAGAFRRAAAVVIGQLADCDEPGGATSADAVVSEFFADFSGPVVTGFPSGHTRGTPKLSIPFGVDVRVVAPAAGTPRVVFEEAAGE